MFSLFIRMANSGKIVIVAALDGTFMRQGKNLNSLSICIHKLYLVTYFRLWFSVEFITDRRTSDETECCLCALP